MLWRRQTIPGVKLWPLLEVSKVNDCSTTVTGGVFAICFTTFTQRPSKNQPALQVRSDIVHGEPGLE